MEALELKADSDEAGISIFTRVAPAGSCVSRSAVAANSFLGETSSSLMWAEIAA